MQGVTALYSEFEGNSGGWSLGQDKPCESMASVQRIGPDGSAALAKVRSTIPTFENIPTEQIGLRTVTRSSASVNPCSPADACNPAGIHTSAASVGGCVPSVSGLSLTGSPAAGSTIKASYAYTDPDGDREGYSLIRWYVSDSVDGVYTRKLIDWARSSLSAANIPANISNTKSPRVTAGCRRGNPLPQPHSQCNRLTKRIIQRGRCSLHRPFCLTIAF